MPDKIARRAQQRRFAQAREAERGDYDPDRGDYDPDRGDYDPDRGDYDPDRGDYDPDRGDYDPDRGGSLGVGAAGAQASRVATDIFRRAAGIGGHLIVAFVAPVGASTSRPRFRARGSASETEATAARAQVAALMELLRQSRAKAGQQNPTSPTPPNDAHDSSQTSAYASTEQPAPATSGSGRNTAE